MILSTFTNFFAQAARTAAGLSPTVIHLETEWLASIIPTVCVKMCTWHQAAEITVIRFNNIKPRSVPRELAVNQHLYRFHLQLWIKPSKASDHNCLLQLQHNADRWQGQSCVLTSVGENIYIYKYKYTYIYIYIWVSGSCWLICTVSVKVQEELKSRTRAHKSLTAAPAA